MPTLNAVVPPPAPSPAARATPDADAQPRDDAHDPGFGDALADARAALDPHAVPGAKTASTAASTAVSDDAAQDDGAPPARHTEASDVAATVLIPWLHLQHLVTPGPAPRDLDAAAWRSPAHAAAPDLGAARGASPDGAHAPLGAASNHAVARWADRDANGPLETLGAAPASPAGTAASIATRDAGAAFATLVTSHDATPRFDGLVPTQSFEAVLAASGRNAAVEAAAPAAVPSIAIDATLGSDRFGAALGERVVWMARHSLERADITVHPADLGPVHVKLAVDHGVVSIDFVAPAQHAREAIQDAIPQLRDALANAGLALGNTDVRDGHARDFAFAAPTRDPDAAPRDTVTDATPPAVAATPLTRLDDGWRIDLYV